MVSSTRAARALVMRLRRLFVIAPVGRGRAGSEPGLARRCATGVTVQGITQHLQALQDIATANGGTRASGTPGYAASRDYVVRRLQAAGLAVTVQQFDFDFFRKTGPASFSRTSDDPDTTFTEGEDFNVLDYSGNGTATGTVQAVDVNFADPSTITSGCEDADFATFTAGNIALLQRGTCPFGDKVVNAQEAGATGAIVFNQGNGGPDRTDLFAGTLGAPRADPGDQRELRVRPGAVGGGHDGLDHDADGVRDASDVERHRRYGAAKNAKKAGKTVVVGAHLDSVVEGPGINDNGSGSATILEIAEEMAELTAAGEPGALRVLGRRGVGPAGLRALRRVAQRLPRSRRSG